ncbi:hypothetical protein ACFL5X_03485 [Candidatus Omnitrophota bacterium]
MTKIANLSRIKESLLLETRICDLPLQIEGTWLASCVSALYAELESKSLVFKPECYLADEWCAPDNEPVLGMPFFLAHPALMRLEKKMMLEVEGGTKQWCMRLLRHETGHAINYAYKLYRRKSWQKVFGKFTQEYADTYRFQPYSKSFVRHLENYYAQYHPDEDFSETFAVWLTPRSKWLTQYRGWKALAKLEYVDKLMSRIRQKEPLVKKGTKYWALPGLKIKLKNYYKKKRKSWEEYFPDFHDPNLRRIFVQRCPESKDLTAASEIIRKYKRTIRDTVSAWTGEKKHIIDELLMNMVARCKDLELVVEDPEAVTVSKISTYLTTLTMNYIYTGRFQKRKK